LDIGNATRATDVAEMLPHYHGAETERSTTCACIPVVYMLAYLRTTQRVSGCICWFICILF